jgi:hypothetical protein
MNLSLVQRRLPIVMESAIVIFKNRGNGGAKACVRVSKDSFNTPQFS